jgi:hypothetical protein
MSYAGSSAECGWCLKDISNGAEVACRKCYEELEGKCYEELEGKCYEELEGKVCDLEKEIETLKEKLADVKASA